MNKFDYKIHNKILTISPVISFNTEKAKNNITEQLKEQIEHFESELKIYFDEGYEPIGGASLTFDTNLKYIIASQTLIRYKSDIT
jgi:hypothetical protein